MHKMFLHILDVSKKLATLGKQEGFWTYFTLEVQDQTKEICIYIYIVFWILDDLCQGFLTLLGYLPEKVGRFVGRWHLRDFRR